MEVQVLEHIRHSLLSDRNKDLIIDKLLSLTMEIICLLTREDFIVVRKSGDQVTDISGHPVSDRSSGTQSPNMEAPPHASSVERRRDRNIQAPTEVYHRDTGKVPGKCKDVEVSFSVTEWDCSGGHNDVVMDPPQLRDSVAGECSSRSPPGRCETPLYSGDYIKEENRIVIEDYQAEPGHGVYHPQCKEEEPVPDPTSSGGCSSRTPADPCETPLYSPGCIEEENRTVTQEYQDEPGHVIYHRQCKEEAVPADISPGVLASWKVQGDSPHSLLPVQGHQTNVPTPDFPLGIILSENSAKDSSRRAHAVPDKAPALKRPIHVTDLVKKQRKVDNSSVNFIGHGNGNQNKEQTTERMVYKCRRTYYSEIDLAAHQRTNSDERRYLCGECPLSFTDLSVLEAHQWNFHRQELGAISAPQRPTPEDRPFSCSECGRSFTKKSTLVKHQRIHTGAFACPDCGKCLSDKTGLILHRRTHTGEKPFACSECGRRFTQMCHLVTHQSVHTREKPFACTECGKCFSIRSVLIAHQAIHARHKTFRCPECGKSFTQKADLATHWMVHSKEPGSTS